LYPAADSQETQDCFGEMAAGKPTDPLVAYFPFL
jgi:hypothetical protein